MIDTDLDGLVVLVTGSSSGIGRAITRRFGVQGARVAVTYHSDESGAETTATRVVALGGECYAVNVACLDDATDEELAEAPITSVDGWNDRTSPPRRTPTPPIPPDPMRNA